MVSLVITPDMKRQINDFKESLIEIRNYPNVSKCDAKTIDIVLNELDDYDRNFIIAYYTIGNCKVSTTAKIFNTTMPNISRRRDSILNKIRKLNDCIKSIDNQPVDNSNN